MTVATRERCRATPTPFAADLGRHGGRLALVTPEGRTLTYAELGRRSQELADRLGPVRRLVLLEADNDLDSIVAYLACLAAGHPVLVTPAGSPFTARLTTHYDPDVVLSAGQEGWWVDERREGTRHDLHPDLAVILSTSGSTGSPKLVRLSQANLQSNAVAIAEYLGLTERDRAATTLPMAYCYGLSVISSHLSQGASLLVTGLSVVDTCFWDAFRREQATSFAGVPHTFDLLDRVRFEEMDLPHLRYVTQAGGRLAPERVRRYAQLGRRRGWDFYVMYGQTEATARIAYLPPHLAASHPGSIGVPVPGGSLEIEPVDGLPAGEGELVYRGPNVMLGYAGSPSDLALGRTVEVLRTGDLGRRNALGLYEITGRARRFVKPFGLRIDLDRVEQVLAEQGHTALCTGDDQRLVLAVAGSEPGAAATASRLVARCFGLPPAAVQVRLVGALPRLANGKPDYATVASWFPPAPAGPLPASPPRDLPSCASRPKPLNDEFARVLGCEVATDADTFADLGGDSLSYVEMSVRIEEALGYLPDGWHVMPIGELNRLEPRRRPAGSQMETSVVLRALAIVGVVGTHVGLFDLLGGAHLLLAIAGFNFARFQLTSGDQRHHLRRAFATIGRIAVPTMAYVGLLYLASDRYTVANVLLTNNYLADGVWRYWYWFVEVLVQVLLLAAVAFAVPGVRRLERRHPFRFALAVLFGALALRHVPMGDPANDIYRTHSVLWLFALGWLVHRSTTAHQKALVSVLAVLAVPTFFAEPSRDAVVTAGILAVLWVGSVRVPRLAGRLLATLAASSMYVYLVHWQVYPVLDRHLPALPVTLLTVLAGVVAWLTVRAVEGGVARAWRAGTRLLSAPEALRALAGPLDPVHRVVRVMQQRRQRGPVIGSP